MIFQNVELHNVTSLVEAPEGGWYINRLPEEVNNQLNSVAQGLNHSGINCEIRFVAEEGETVKITLATEVDKPATVVYYYDGSFPSGWGKSSRNVNRTPTELVIPYADNMKRLKDLARKLHHPFSPTVTRVILPCGSFRLISIEGKCRPPREDEKPKRKYLAYGSSITQGNATCAQVYNK